MWIEIQEVWEYTGRVSSQRNHGYSKQQESYTSSHCTVVNMVRTELLIEHVSSTVSLKISYKVSKKHQFGRLQLTYKKQIGVRRLVVLLKFWGQTYFVEIRRSNFQCERRGNSSCVSKLERHLSTGSAVQQMITSDAGVASRVYCSTPCGCLRLAITAFDDPQKFCW